jgi:hypothetical protein
MLKMRTFKHSEETEGWPDPLCDDLKPLSDAELASYIAACKYEFDGMPGSVREALVRLLRRPVNAPCQSRSESV